MLGSCVSECVEGIGIGKVGGAYGSGIEMTTSCNVTLSFSSSYSMLTSQVPSFEGEGQQLTWFVNERGNEKIRLDSLLDSGTKDSSCPA